MNYFVKEALEDMMKKEGTIAHIIYDGVYVKPTIYTITKILSIRSDRIVVQDKFSKRVTLLYSRIMRLNFMNQL